MTDSQTRIETLLEATNNWLKKENHYLMDAVDQTVQEGYFSFQDITFALDALEESLSETALQEWCERVQISDDRNANAKNVLCLHAGNLPLVGFQDAFATLLSGARYTGKISSKDPYLLPTFLNEVKKTAVWTDRDVQWTHRLDDFEGMPHDDIIFAGSESSVPGVKKAIDNLELAHNHSRYLIRTSHFSLAYVDRKDERTMSQLAEGILRYGGMGCRSIAIVVSPFSLDEIKCDLTDYIEEFWLENPQYQEPSSKLGYQYAYNKAVKRSQKWLEYFLVQEGGLELDQDFVCYWVKGDKNKAAEIAQNYRRELQSIYIPHPDIKIPGFEGQTEFLSDVQRPPISWKPDGVDTLEWLSE